MKANEGQRLKVRLFRRDERGRLLEARSDTIGYTLILTLPKNWRKLTFAVPR